MITHRHHIIPKHEWKKKFGNLSGFNAHDNVVFLSVEQHSEVHKLLWEQFGREEDHDAWLALTGIKSKEEIIYKAQKAAGIKSGNLHKESGHCARIAALGGKAKRGIKHTPEAKLKMSLAKIGTKNSFYGKKHTEESKRKMRESKLS